MKYSIAIDAFGKAEKEGFIGTDDVSLVERMGKKVKIVECDPENIKITLPSDIEFGNSLLNDSRIGIGHDSHRFQDGKKLVIGGFQIEGHPGFDSGS